MQTYVIRAMAALLLGGITADVEARTSPPPQSVRLYYRSQAQAKRPPQPPPRLSKMRQPAARALPGSRWQSPPPPPRVAFRGYTGRRGVIPSRPTAPVLVVRRSPRVPPPFPVLLPVHSRPPAGQAAGPAERADKSNGTGSNSSLLTARPQARLAPAAPPEVRQPPVQLPSSPAKPPQTPSSAEPAHPGTAEAKTSEAQAGEEFDHLPFGVPVPGKAGYVTLPGPQGNLPHIDVRGIAPGTPVEIPDPEVPGSTIQFRVP